MAVSIKQTPGVMMPVYNSIVFTVDSTNKAQCSFRYICDIYVNGSFITRLKLFPDGSNGYAEFKINRVLEDFLSYDLHVNLYGANLFARNTYTALEYQLKFGEEYDNSSQCDAGTTIYDNLTTTSIFRAFNGAIQYIPGVTWSATDYTMTGSTSKFLTDVPDNSLIHYGDQLTFNFINTGSVKKLYVETYNAAGSVIGTYSYDNTYMNISNYQDRIITVGVGPENLNNTTLTTGTQPVITSLVSYYKIQLRDVNDLPLSEIRTIEIDKRYTKYTHHRLWWLNRLGGFDSYTYTLNDARRIESTRTEYNKLYGQYVAPSSWTYNIGDRGRTVLNVNAQESNTYHSNWLTEPESIWMEQLFTSPEVYLQYTNKILCFNSFYVQPILNDLGEVSTNFLSFSYNPNEYSFSEGETAIIDFGNDRTFRTVASAELIIIEEGTIGIYLGGTFSPGYNFVTGYVLPKNFVSKLDPVIIKSSTYEEKVKKRIKNINYSIDVEKAYAVNVQRN